MDDLVLAHSSGEETHVGHHALVRVVVRVEDQALQRRVRVTGRRRDALDDGFEHLGHTGPILGRHEQDLLARYGEHVLQFVHDHRRLGRGEVDLVDHRHDDKSLGKREMDIGERLCLDALSRVDDQDRALARLQAATDLVREVDVAGSVDQVQPVALAVACVVFEAHGAGLDGDAVLAFQIHRVEHLAGHLSCVDGVRQFDQAIGEG